MNSPIEEFDASETENESLLLESMKYRPLSSISFSPEGSKVERKAQRRYCPRNKRESKCIITM